ncbi:hypothetical protein EMIT048CA2_250042 [Pseudomonas chlororaphis]
MPRPSEPPNPSWPPSSAKAPQAAPSDSRTASRAERVKLNMARVSWSEDARINHHPAPSLQALMLFVASYKICSSSHPTKRLFPAQSPARLGRRQLAQSLLQCLACAKCAPLQQVTADDALAYRV